MALLTSEHCLILENSQDAHRSDASRIAHQPIPGNPGTEKNQPFALGAIGGAPNSSDVRNKPASSKPGISRFEQPTPCALLAAAAYGLKPWRWATDVLLDALHHLRTAGTYPDLAARIARELDERGAMPARVPAHLLLRLACPAVPGRC